MEASILRDWIEYTKMGHIRLVNSQSAYAEFLSDMIDIVSGIVEE